LGTEVNLGLQITVPFTFNKSVKEPAGTSMLWFNFSILKVSQVAVSPSITSEVLYSTSVKFSSENTISPFSLIKCLAESD
jgi:hypothetical protein